MCVWCLHLVATLLNNFDFNFNLALDGNQKYTLSFSKVVLS